MVDQRTKGISWQSIRQRIKAEYGTSPSYYNWLKLVELLNIPYQVDQMSGRKTYDWDVVSKLYSGRHRNVSSQD